MTGHGVPYEPDAEERGWSPSPGCACGIRPGPPEHHANWCPIAATVEHPSRMHDRAWRVAEAIAERDAETVRQLSGAATWVEQHMRGCDFERVCVERDDALRLNRIACAERDAATERAEQLDKRCDEYADTVNAIRTHANEARARGDAMISIGWVLAVLNAGSDS